MAAARKTTTRKTAGGKTVARKAAASKTTVGKATTRKTIPHLAEPLVPDSVKVVFSDRKTDWLFPLVRLDRWSPFMAACIFFGLCPGKYNATTKTAEAIWEWEPNVEDLTHLAGCARTTPARVPENYEHDVDYGGQIKALAKVIARNASDQGHSYVTPSDIVPWAVITKTISAESDVAREFQHAVPNLDVHMVGDSKTERSETNEKIVEHVLRVNEQLARLSQERDDFEIKAKNSGKHFAERREAILAAALHILANERDKCIDGNGRVVGAKLGNLLQDNRVKYGFGHEDAKPVPVAMNELITNAVSGNRWKIKNRD